MKRAVAEAKLGIPEDQLDKIIDEVDYFGNHQISYTEFLAATLDSKHVTNGEMLSEIFHQFDTDGSGSITKENIVNAMAKIGKTVTDKEADLIMKEHDLHHDGRISYHEFELLFTIS